jgi:hypothetical protein
MGTIYFSNNFRNAKPIVGDSIDSIASIASISLSFLGTANWTDVTLVSKADVRLLVSLT